jgi:hypothetical protein
MSCSESPQYDLKLLMQAQFRAMTDETLNRYISRRKERVEFYAETGMEHWAREATHKLVWAIREKEKRNNEH